MRILCFGVLVLSVGAFAAEKAPASVEVVRGAPSKRAPAKKAAEVKEVEVVKPVSEEEARAAAEAEKSAEERKRAEAARRKAAEELAKQVQGEFGRAADALGGE